MRETLKKIKVSQMCGETNLNEFRIRNYINGRIAHLSPEEENRIREYFNSLVSVGKRG